MKKNNVRQIQKEKHHFQLWWVLYISRHVDALITAIGRLSRAPIATFMTVAVIGISLALPMGLYFLLDQAETVTQGWRKSSRISLFLRMDISNYRINQLVARIKEGPDVENVEVITSKQALEEFQKMSGFDEMVKLLPGNPFPTVLQVQPDIKANSKEALTQMLTRFQTFPDVELAQLDIDWVERLRLFLEIMSRSVSALALLLALGVVLIVGNTIRLSSENYRDELDIAKLVGASDAFVRRPFLYTGALYGLMGGIIAWLCIDFIVLWMYAPLKELLALYQSSLEVSELGLLSVLMLLGAGIILGLVGAFFAVRHFLRQHETCVQ